MTSTANALKHRLNTNIEFSLRYGLADLALERELMEPKWFGYRFMSPVKATRLFTDIYIEQTRSAAHRNRDRNLKVKGVNWIEYHARGPEFTMLWRARQRADIHCVPYETYISFCIHFASRRTRRFDPRPSQLHATAASAEAWHDQFLPWCEDRKWLDFRRLDVPQFHLSHFEGLPPQVAYRDYILSNAKGSLMGCNSQRRLIELYCYERNEIDIQAFGPMIDSDNLESIMSILNADLRAGTLTAREPQKLEREHLWTSCFGWPGCRDEQAAICIACPLSGQCKRISEFAAEKVMAATGERDPVEAARLSNQNERQKLSRARKRAKAAASASSAAL